MSALGINEITPSISASQLMPTASAGEIFVLVAL